MDSDLASGNNSPGLTARPFAYSAVSDEEDETRHHDTPQYADSEASWDGHTKATGNMQHDETNGGSGMMTPGSQPQDGMLPRDYQRKTAFYDYAAEKQLSQADAKLFYQRSQLDGQRGGGSQYSPQGSPIIRSRTYSSMDDQQALSGSLHSMHSMPQRYVIYLCEHAHLSLTMAANINIVQLRQSALRISTSHLKPTLYRTLGSRHILPPYLSKSPFLEPIGRPARTIYILVCPMSRSLC